jgi:hypothetical protein
MNTCATCKHRGKEPIEACNGRTNWDCVPSTYYECKMATHDKRADYEPGHQALVIDGSGYMAKLCVELTFGCNKWEAK